MPTPIPASLALAALIGTTLSPAARGSNDEGVGPVLDLGFVRLSRPDEPDDGGDAFASFVRFHAAVPGGELLASFRPEVDTCRIESDADETGSGGEDLFRSGAGRPFDFTSAGDTVEFTGPDGTWLVLTAIEESDFRGYRPASRPVPAPVPASLTVDVPGADFPAFAAVPVREVERLVVLEPSDDEGVPVDAVFRWEALAASEARIEIELEFDDADDGEDIDVTCSAADDGEFGLPRNVLDRVPAGATAEIEMQRVALTVRDGDGALLVVKSEAGGGF